MVVDLIVFVGRVELVAFGLFYPPHFFMDGRDYHSSSDSSLDKLSLAATVSMVLHERETRNCRQCRAVMLINVVPEQMMMGAMVDRSFHGDRLEWVGPEKLIDRVHYHSSTPTLFVQRPIDRRHCYSLTLVHHTAAGG